MIIIPRMHGRIDEKKEKKNGKASIVSLVGFKPSPRGLRAQIKQYGIAVLVVAVGALSYIIPSTQVTCAYYIPQHLHSSYIYFWYT